MKNKGYYSWIHSLKNAAIESVQKGAEMINEEKAKKASAAAKQRMEAQLSAPPPAPTKRSFKTSGDEEIINIPDLGSYTKSEIDTAIQDTMQLSHMAGEKGFERPSAHSVSLGGGDAKALLDARRRNHAERLAAIALSKGPVDAKPAGTAQDVEDDARDGVMADPEGFKVPSASNIPDAPPPTRQHPEPIYKSAEEANAVVKGLNAMRFAQQNPMSAEDIAAAEEAEEDKALYGATSPTAAWRTVKEDSHIVSSKISKLLKEKNG